MTDSAPLEQPDVRTADRYQPLVMVFAAAAAGTVTDRYLPVAFWGWWLLAAGSIAAWLIAWRGGRLSIACCCLLASLLATGACWHHLAWFLFAPNDLGRFAHLDEQPTCVEAIALDAPTYYPAEQRSIWHSLPQRERSSVPVRVVALRNGQAWQPASGRTSLSVDGVMPAVSAGARLRVFATLGKPAPPMNPGEFDFARHARSDRQLSRLSAHYSAGVTVISAGRQWSVWHAADGVRHAGHAVLQEYLPGESGDLAAAMLLGMRNEVPQNVFAQFRVTGMAHLLVVSGLHVGVLALGLFLALRIGLLSRGTALLLVVVTVGLFAMIVQGRPPVVRATALIAAMCLARFSGRRAFRFNSLAAAALVVLAINPNDLFRTGPQLSFLAVGTLIWWAPRWTGPASVDPLDHLITQARPWYLKAARWIGRWYWRMTCASAAIWLVLTPLLVLRYHVNSPVSVPLNALLWPLVAAALLSGFALLFVGWIVPPLGAMLAAVCDVCFRATSGLVSEAAEWPGGHFWSAGPATWWVIGFYAGLLALVVLPGWRPPRRWCWALLALWTTAGIVPALLPARDRGRLHCTFLSLGHGCCAVLELPDGQSMLYDAGTLGSPDAAVRSISAFLWWRGIEHLDAVVLSHADIDHYNALPALMRRFSVGVVYVSPVMFDPVFPAGSEVALTALHDAIDAAGVPIRQTWAGDRLRGPPSVEITVLHPPRIGVLGSDNANSLVLRIEFDGRVILLPGDLETPGLEDVMAELPIDCDVLLAPHHGSRRSDPPGFAAWSTPDWVVVSGGARHDRGQLADAYERQGARVLHTADVGAVRLSIATNQRVIQVETEKKGQFADIERSEHE